MRIREDATTMIAIRRLLRSEFSSLDRSFARDALSELPLSVARPCETFFEIGDERNTTTFHFLTIATVLLDRRGWKKFRCSKNEITRAGVERKERTGTKFRWLWRA